MAQKHLKEILKEDQEPFHLKNYIADRQCQLKKQENRSQIQLKKPKPISKNTSFFRKNACFFYLQDSPKPCKSPLFDFPKSPNRVLLHVPAKTASMLLEAAKRIQSGKKPKTQMKNSGFGLLGSMLNRLKPRNKVQKMKDNKTGEIKTGENRGEVIVEEKVVNATSSTLSSSSSSGCSCDWRMSGLDLESSSSGRSFNGEDDNGGFEFANVVRENDGDYGVCLSPFNFSLHSSHSPDKSPVCHKIKKIQEEEDEEDKKQSSPVSVMDPLFDDDYDVHEEDNDYDYDLECNYAFAQRAKQHLLNKLHMFEKWADLDPIEVEKTLIEDRDEQLVLEQEEDCEEYDYESFTFDDQENTNNALESDEQVIKMVCKRLKSWKEMEGNTIDMMVEMDLKREIDGWKKSQEHIGEVAIDLEVAIFALLVDELVEDLLNFA